jgi:hypothetical protein
MLKNTSSGLANVNELAKNMININTKWSNLNKRIDAKNRLFAQLAEHINELRRTRHVFSYFLFCKQSLNDQLFVCFRAASSRKHVAKQSPRKAKLI